MWTDFDRQMMGEALRQAGIALEMGEIPVGAVVAREGKMVAAAHNTRESDNDPSGHAEINVLREAARCISDWRLTGCTLYVTLEPCCMCAGAIVQARVDRVIFGAYDAQAGACGSLYRINEDPAFNHFTRADGGLMAKECAALMNAALKRGEKDG